jgi:hypothetical protein
MNSKLVVGLVAFLLVFSLTAVSPSLETAFAQEAVETEQETLAFDSALMNTIFEDMTLVWVQDEAYASIIAACAGVGLNSVQPALDGPKILIPNAGDLSVDGSNVSVKLTPDGEISFVPRVQGQMIRVPMNVGDKVAGQEVLSLTLDEAQQLAASGMMVWTAQGFGPQGTGHGLPGHIASCDPRFDEQVWDQFADDDDEDEVQETS